jgi:hypothetical protein
VFKLQRPRLGDISISSVWDPVDDVAEMTIEIWNMVRPWGYLGANPMLIHMIFLFLFWGTFLLSIPPSGSFFFLYLLNWFLPMFAFSWSAWKEETGGEKGFCICNCIKSCEHIFVDKCILVPPIYPLWNPARVSLTSFHDSGFRDIRSPCINRWLDGWRYCGKWVPANETIADLFRFPIPFALSCLNDEFCSHAHGYPRST